MKLSLITIFSGRQQHLKNQLTGIAKGSSIPDEIIIVGINDKFNTEEFPTLPIKFININWEGKHLPIAKARNLGAEYAENEFLIFLDVDCIPSRTFIEKMFTDLQENAGCIMGNPYYLEAHIDIKNEDLENRSKPHPIRPNVKELSPCNDYNLFWSLCFGIRKSDFLKIEGFDTNFNGYGGEDTDFAWKLEKQEIPIYLTEHLIFHQQHPVYSPPLNHLDPIIQNVKYFKAKWGKWIMENWLEAFAENEYIRWNSNNNILEKIRDPNESELKNAYKPEAPYM